MIDLILEILTFGPTIEGVQYAFNPMLMTVMGGAQALAGFDWGGKRRKALAKARSAYQKQKDVYRGLEITNPYEGVREELSRFENVMEDLTVNRQQAEFQRNMFLQQQANVMQGLQGAAGASGIAGLAQAMTMQGMTRAQKMSASIGQQEAQNRLLAAQQEAKLQQLEAKGIEAEARGEQERQAAEMSREATLLGMDAQAVEGAQSAVMQGKHMLAQGLGTALGGLSGGFDAQGKWSSEIWRQPYK